MNGLRQCKVVSLLLHKILKVHLIRPIHWYLHCWQLHLTLTTSYISYMVQPFHQLCQEPDNYITPVTDLRTSVNWGRPHWWWLMPYNSKFDLMYISIALLQHLALWCCTVTWSFFSQYYVETPQPSTMKQLQTSLQESS